MEPIRPYKVAKARKVFATRESRDLFYRTATELVRLALERKTSLSVTEAIAVLLQTWNSSFYRYRKFSNQHFTKLGRLVGKHNATLAAFRRRRIDTLVDSDKEVVLRVFGDFKKLLGPVGAAKCLHLLAPYFFPLWDRTIASKGYGLPIGRTGTNAKRYWEFMRKVKDQVLALVLDDDTNPLKAIDEYNYCTYTKGWI